MIAVVGVVALIELCRRSVGLPILCVVGALLVYTLSQVQWRVAIYNLFYTTTGVMNTPVNVCAKYIVVFIIFGAFLERTGIARILHQPGQLPGRLLCRRSGQGGRHLLRSVRHGVWLLRGQHRHHRLRHHPHDEKDGL